VKRCRLLFVGLFVGFLANEHSRACLRQAYLGVHQTGSSPIIVVKIRGERYSWDKLAGHLITGQAATGV
jgi:hypothetical protein